MHSRDPGFCPDHLTEAHLLGDQDGMMQLLGGNRSRFVGDVESAGRVGEKLDIEAEMQSLASRCIAAHLGHIPGDRDCVDVMVAQPALQIGSGETAGQVLMDERGARADSHLGPKLPFKAATAEDGAVRLGSGVLDNDDWNARNVSGVHGRQNRGQGVSRIRHWQLSNEILVLDVDD